VDFTPKTPGRWFGVLGIFVWKLGHQTNNCMQSITYHLDASELDNRLIDSIKSLFTSGWLTVEVHTDEREITNQALLHTLRSNDVTTQHYDIPAADFARIADAVTDDESFDAVTEIKKFITVH
jgi:hypothetical protein